MAKARGRELAHSYELWFRQTYRLAPTDPRFLRATAEEIEAEYWAYQYQDNKVKEEIEDEDFSLADVLAQIQQQAMLPATPSANPSPQPSTPLAVAYGEEDWEEVDLG